MKTVYKLVFFTLIILMISCDSSVKNTPQEEVNWFDTLTPEQQDSVKAERAALQAERKRRKEEHRVFMKEQIPSGLENYKFY